MSPRALRRLLWNAAVFAVPLPILALGPGLVRLRMGRAVKGRQRDFIFRHRLADGAIGDVVVRSGPIVLGGRTLLYSIIHDITERRRAEADLRFEREQLLSLFDSMDTLVYVTDPSTNEILYVNKALEYLLGRQVVGGICHRVFQGLEAPCPFCTNEIILRQNPAPHYWDYYNPTMDRHFSIIDRIIKWPDGRNVRVELATDITERKQVEDALKLDEARLEALLRLNQTIGIEERQRTYFPIATSAA